jgi:hypothetical protein
VSRYCLSEKWAGQNTWMFVLQSSTTTAQLRAPFKLASGENRGRTESFFFGAKIAVKKGKLCFKNNQKRTLEIKKILNKPPGKLQHRGLQDFIIETDPDPG